MISDTLPQNKIRVALMLKLVFFGLSLLITHVAGAQTISVSGGAPSEALSGEQVCAELEISNSGSPGYNPYLRVSFESGLSFGSALSYGSPLTPLAPTPLVFPAAPDNQVIDPLTMTEVTGPEGGTFILLRLPVGSVIDGAPAVPVELCFNLDLGLPIGVPLELMIQPVYGLGDTPTGVNGPIVGPLVSQTVTPVLVLVEKNNAVPESEVPPGPTWAFPYVLGVDIANGETIDDLVITDILPGSLVYNGGLSVTGGAGCSAIEPVIGSAGGTLDVNCTSATGGPGGGDVLVTFQVYIGDVLSEASCDSQSIINSMSFDAMYSGNALPTLSRDSALTSSNATVQKGATPSQVVPGLSRVTYTLDIQITEFSDVTDLVIDDLLPSGMDLVEGSLSINGGGMITFSSPLNSSDASFVENGDGTSSISIDLAGLGITSIAASSIQVRYQADVLSAFGFDAGNDINAADSLTTSAGITFDLSDGAAACRNSTASTVEVAPVSPAKESVSSGPYRPGDFVTYRLSLAVPSGDTRAIVFTDYLPLPVYNAATLSTATPLASNPDIVLAPTNTVAGIEPSLISVDVATNSLRIEWPDVATNMPQVLAVDVSIEISDDPFADGLNLSNLLLVETENSVGTARALLDPINFEIGAPVLTIDKSVTATSSGIAPDGLGDVSGVDAGDVVTFAVTLVNDGGAPAFDVTVTDATLTGFSSCSLVGVQVGGSTITTSGSLAAGVVLSGSLAESDGAAGGSDEAVLALNCTVDSVSPEDVITNIASATWASQPGATAFPPITDDATAEVPGVAINKELVSVFPTETALGLNADGTANEVAIGSLVRYRVSITVPEGETNNVILRDQLDNGLAFANLGGFGGDFCAATFPASVSFSNGSIDSTCSNVGTAAGANPRLVDVGGVPARRAVIDLDTVSVRGNGASFSDQTTNATIVFEYVVLVLDVGSNGDSNQRNNTAQFRLGANATGDGGALAAQGSAPNVIIREPNFTFTKMFTPSTGDAGVPTTVSIVVTSAGGDNNPDTFDVVLEDILDPDLLFVGNLITGSCAAVPDAGTLQFDVGTQTLSAQWSTFTKGTSCEITFDAEVAATAPIGTAIPNQAVLDLSSLPDGGFGEPNEFENQSPYIDEPRDSERTDTITADASFLVAPITQQKTVITRTETMGSGQGSLAIVDVTVGEVITYNILASVPDGSANNLVITDKAVTSPFKLELLSVSSITIGVDIENQAISGIPPVPVVVIDDSDSDGLNDEAVIDLGDILNLTDTGSTVAADNQIEFQITARVVETANNAAGSLLRNNIIVSSDTFSDVIASADMEIVEPSLFASKSGSITSGQAGNVVVFTLDVGHSGTSDADARQVAITDTLPTTFNNISNLVFVGGVNCPTATPTSSGIASNVISIAFDEIPLNEVCRFTYDATIDNSVEVTSTIRNNVVFNYASTDEGDANEIARDYTGGTDFAITISSPGIQKTFISSADSTTPDAGGKFGVEPDITIGEEITYQILVTIPSGTTSQAIVSEQLPYAGSAPAAQFTLLSAVLSSIPAGVTIGSGLAAGAGPTSVFDSAPLDGTNDRFEFDLGDVVNSTGVAQILEFMVVAVPDNVMANFDVDNARNTASLDFTVGGIDQPTLSDSADVDVVRPDLEISKTPDSLPDQSAADTLTFTLAITHSGVSGATAYDLALTDTLPDPGSSAPTNVTASPDCQGFGFTVPGLKTLNVTVDQLDLGATCTITYDVTVDGTVFSGASYSNEASVAFDSTPGNSGDTFPAVSDSGTFSIDRPDLVKTVFFVENPLLGTSTTGDPLVPDAQIGAEICYHSMVTFPEGITEDAVFADSLPSGGVNGAQGIMRITTASVFGAGLLGASNGFADILITDDLGGDGIDDTATFDFGDITNSTVDNAVTEADQLVLQVCGTVLNMGPTNPNNAETNEEGDVLTNTSQIFFTDPGIGGGTTTQTATADIEIIEPKPVVTKSLVSVVDGLVTIQIDLNNAGLGTGFDVLVTDTLLATDFDLATIVAVTVPPGYLFSVTGGDTVRFESDSAALAADNTLEPGETANFVFEVMLADPRPDLTSAISNTANASLTSMPGTPVEDRTTTDSDTVDLSLPLLDATKSDVLQIDADGSSSVSGGDTLRYSIVVSNTGAGSASNIFVEDLLTDANLTLVPGSVTTTAGTVNVGNGGADTTIEVFVPAIAAAGSATVTFDALIASPLPSGVTEVANQASISSDEQEDFVSDDPDTGPNDDPTVVPLVRMADLAITKIGSPNPAVPGEILTFTLLVENLGPDPVVDAQVTDALPGTLLNPTWRCTPSVGASCSTTATSIATGDTINDGPNVIPVGGTLTYVIFGQVLPSATGSLANSAQVNSAGTTDPVPANNDDTVIVPLTPLADLMVAKSTTATTLNPGDTITYALVVTNNGSSDAVAAQLFDPTPAGLSVVSVDAPCAAGFPCALGTLAPGDIIPINVTLQVNNPYGGSGSVFNEVSVNSITPDAVPDNNSDDVTTPVGIAAGADVSLIKSGPPSAAVGSTVTFLLSATNNGPYDAQNVVITDPIPAGLSFNGGTPACVQVGSSVECSLGTLGVGELSVAMVTFDIPAVYSGPDPIPNTAAVTSTTPDPVASNNASATDVPLTGDSVNLSINKVGPDTADAGDTLSYMFSIVNAGPGDATGVVLSDPTPTGLTYNDGASDALCNLGGGGATCNIGDLAAGGSATLTIAFDIDDPYSGPDVILNTAAVSANEPDADLSDNTDSALTSTTGVAPVDLALVKSGPALLGGSGIVAYTLNVRNNGGGEAENVVVTDPVPDQLTYLDPDSDARCGLVGADVVCNLGDLFGGGSTTLLLAFAVPLDYTGGNPLVNNATVSSDSPDANPSNDTDNHLVDVTPSIDADKAGELFVDDDGSTDLTLGDTIRYTVQVANSGQVATTDVEFTDTPDANTTLVVGSVTTTQGAVITGNGGGDATIAIDLGQIDGQDSVTITYDVLVPLGLPSNIRRVVNQGEVTSNELPPEPTNDPSTAQDDDPTVLNLVREPMLVPINSLWMLALMAFLMLTFGARYTVFPRS